MNKHIIEKNYKAGLWSEAMVKMAVRKGVITQEQCDSIISGQEVAPTPVVDSGVDEILNIIEGSVE